MRLLLGSMAAKADMETPSSARTWNLSHAVSYCLKEPYSHILVFQGSETWGQGGEGGGVIPFGEASLAFGRLGRKSKKCIKSFLPAPSDAPEKSEILQGAAP